MKKKTFYLLTILFIFWNFANESHAQMQSSNYRITTTVLSGGGVPMGSTTYQTTGTLGQPSPLMDLWTPPYSTSYDLYPGFYYTLDAVFLEGCWGDFEPADGDVDGSDLAEFIDNFDQPYLPTFASTFGRDDCFD